MGPEFVRQHAPMLALKPRSGAKGWVTPQPEAGLAPPEAMYDEGGMPLPYIQDQGGPRQFYVPEGKTAYVSPPNQSAVPPVQPTPAPSVPSGAGDVLRGRLPVDGPTVGLAPEPSPSPPAPRGPSLQAGPGPSATVRIPDSQDILAEMAIDQRAYQDARRLHPLDYPRGHQGPIRSIQDLGNMTLGDLMSRFQFRLPVAGAGNEPEGETSSARPARPAGEGRGPSAADLRRRGGPIDLRPNPPRGEGYVTEDGNLPMEQFEPTRQGSRRYMRAAANEENLAAERDEQERRRRAREPLPIRER